MVAQTLPVLTMRRWKAAVSTLLLVLQLAVQVRNQGQSDIPVYAFPKSSIILRVCPLVVPDDRPSFEIRPSSTNNAFLIGEYSPPGQPFRCTSSNGTSCDGRTCTDLSCLFDGFSSEEITNLIIGYTGSSMSGEATIRIEYATQGLYLQNPLEDLTPKPGNESLLTQGIVVYGADDLPTPFIVCNTEDETKSEVVVAGAFGPYTECEESTRGSGQPTFVPLRFNTSRAFGRHRLYAAARNCSAPPEQRSPLFSVSFEDPTTIPTTDVDITTPTDSGTGEPGLSITTIIGSVAGVLAVVCLVVVLVLAIVCYRRKHCNEQRTDRVENATSSPPVLGATHTTRQNGAARNGDVSVRPLLECIYVGGKHYQAFYEGLADCHDVKLKRLEDSNIQVVRGALSRHKCIVYIVQESEDERCEFIKQLECMPMDKAHRTSVFVILFNSTEQDTIQRPSYYVLARAEDPSGEMFSSVSCAKTIVEEVRGIRGEGSQPELAESSQRRQPNDTADGPERVIIHVDHVTHVNHLNVNLPGNKQGDKDTDKLDKIMEGVTKLEDKMDRTQQTLQEGFTDVHASLGVLDDHVTDLTPTGTKTVEGPISTST